jgi:hypothetical protein
VMARTPNLLIRSQYKNVYNCSLVFTTFDATLLFSGDYVRKIDIVVNIYECRN